MNRNELIAEMQGIVDKYVKAYKSDFEIDKESITEWENAWWAVWLVRDYGTQLKRFSNNVETISWVDAVYDNMRVEKAYMVEHRRGEYTLAETTREEIRKRYRDMPRFCIEVFRDMRGNQLMVPVMGGFDTIEKAAEYGEWLKDRMGGQSIDIQEMEWGRI